MADDDDLLLAAFAAGAPPLLAAEAVAATADSRRQRAGSDRRGAPEVSPGGIIPGPLTYETAEPGGLCRCGFPLYRFNGGPLEHVLDGEMQRLYMLGRLACVDRFGYFTQVASQHRP